MNSTNFHFAPDPRRPWVVGTVHDEASLRAAPRLGRGTADLLELRIDAFADDPRPLLRLLPRVAQPIILTVRDRAEGGAADLSVCDRAALFTLFLSHAAFLDIELRNAKKFGDLIGRARQQGVRLILSFHDFEQTPSSARLLRLHAAAREAGADIFKAATQVEALADVMQLAALLDDPDPPPCAVMGMGRFGRVSRLLFAQAGSVLNYGYLGCAQVPGQWPARVLRERLNELLEAAMPQE